MLAEINNILADTDISAMGQYPSTNWYNGHHENNMVFPSQLWSDKHDFLFMFRDATAHEDPTTLARASRVLHDLVPNFNHTTKLPSNSWTFNKTLSNLIRHSSLSANILSVLPRQQELALIISVCCLDSLWQEEHSEIPRPGERHLDIKGHGETGRHHPLCLWPPEHHQHLWEPVPSSAGCVPHEEPASQALRHRGKLRHPAEQQLRTRDWLARLCYQVLKGSIEGIPPLESKNKTRRWNGAEVGERISFSFRFISCSWEQNSSAVCFNSGSESLLTQLHMCLF